MRAKLTSGSLQVFRVKDGKKRAIYMANGQADGAIIPDLTEREYEMHKDRLEVLPSNEESVEAVPAKAAATRGKGKGG